MNQNNSNNQNQLREINAQSNNKRWEPSKNMTTQGYPMELSGYFKATNEMPGRNGPFEVNVIQLVTKDGLGEEIDVAGGKVLEDKLRQIPMGSFVVIRYEGKKQAKSGGNQYNDWKVFVDDNAIPFNQIGGHVVAKKEPPVQNHNNNGGGFGGGNNNGGFGAGNNNQNNNNGGFGGGNNAPFKTGDLPF